MGSRDGIESFIITCRWRLITLLGFVRNRSDLLEPSSSGEAKRFAVCLCYIVYLRIYLRYFSCHFVYLWI